MKALLQNHIQPRQTALGGLLLALILMVFASSLLFYPEMRWGLMALIGVFALGFFLASPWICLQMAALFVFTGVLVSAPVGFTLKGVQAFTLLGLGAWGVQVLLRAESEVKQKLWLLPFVLFYLSILPSFWMVDRAELSLSTAESSFRLLFNYSFLQAFLLLFLLVAQKPEQQEKLYRLGIFSCGLTLLFGYGQQLAFYLGAYDPFLFIGRHQSIVDFYGPFLRFSPGTFANEYGEILQSVALLILARWMFKLPEPKFGAWKMFELGVLIALFPALILNFTRASWLVLFACLIMLMALARVRLWLFLFFAACMAGSLAVLWWLSQWLLEFSILLSLGQRFQELGELQSFSAGERLQTWSLAWQAFLESPWIGHGWGRFGGTHNVPLQLLAETGILGFLGFYALMFWIFRVQIRACWQAKIHAVMAPLYRRQLGYVLALWGCLCFDLTNHGIYHFVLWYLIALGLCNARSILHSENTLDNALIGETTYVTAPGD